MKFIPALFVILASVLTALTQPALAQNNTTDGNCNAIVNGSGNDITIDCAGSRRGQAKSDNVRLVIATNNTPVIQGILNWQYVNYSQSSFSVDIDDDQIIYQSMDDVFDDEQVRLDRGEHFYKFELFISFFNGFSDTVSCSGVIDAQVSAAIVPRMLIAQNPQNGALYPVNCGFTLR